MPSGCTVCKNTQKSCSLLCKALRAQGIPPTQPPTTPKAARSRLMDTARGCGGLPEVTRHPAGIGVAVPGPVPARPPGEEEEGAAGGSPGPTAPHGGRCPAPSSRSRRSAAGREQQPRAEGSALPCRVFVAFCPQHSESLGIVGKFLVFKAFTRCRGAVCSGKARC